MRTREREWTRRKRQRRWGRALTRLPIVGAWVREYGCEQYEQGYRDGGNDRRTDSFDYRVPVPGYVIRSKGSR